MSATRAAGAEQEEELGQPVVSSRVYLRWAKPLGSVLYTQKQAGLVEPELEPGSCVCTLMHYKKQLLGRFLKAHASRGSGGFCVGFGREHFTRL